MSFRVGIGYDVHRFKENRDLIIGGVNIPFEMGLDGHSDADVLVHSIMDALLGSTGFRDIGKLFPDNDNEYKNISSLILLSKVKELIYQKDYKIVNIDSVIIAEKPKMSPFIDEMILNIANCLEIPKEDVNVKATTEEGLGFTGKMEGISSQAICMVEKL